MLLWRRVQTTTLSRGFGLRSCLRLACGGQSSYMSSTPKRVVFLGTSEISLDVLRLLIQASRENDSTFSVVGAVTKPPTEQGRKKRLTPSAVHKFVEENHKDTVQLWTPMKANEKDFLEAMEELKPDLCVTASYGNYLPKRFLAVPKYGTLNVHPSLLPKWRGAAPLQRSLQNGDTEVGVSVLYTVPEMDAGPILRQSCLQLEGDEQFPLLLTKLMQIGTKELIAALPEVWAGTANATEQDHTLASHAAKFDNKDSELNFRTMTASTVHNLVRALKGTFGTFTTFDVCTKGQKVRRRVNILTTILLRAEPDEENIPDNRYGLNTIKFGIIKHPQNKKRHILSVTCFDGSVVGITNIQPATRGQMTVHDFLGGLREGRAIYWTPLREGEEVDMFKKISLKK